MKHYRTIHDKEERGKKKRRLSEELLISKAEEVFERMSKEKFIRDLAKRLDNISIRIDLIGTPETSFIIAVKKGKLKFLTEHIYADMAVGIHKKYFLELLENPPEFGNMKIIHNNIIFRKGRVKLFKYAQPLLASTLFSGVKEVIQKNKSSKVR
ncbi:MAG: hypothetical protein KKA79_02670 [Nanoarchaeota archaeon]|nr:hypothetical protein [Nanoarchaeota archaeon]